MPKRPYVSQRGKLTPKQRVLRYFPAAVATYDKLFAWRILNNLAPLAVGHGTAREAWASAAQEIK